MPLLLWTEESPIAPSQNATVLSVRCYPWARAGLIAPDDQVDYGSASGAEKATYAFICLDTGLMADGKIGYTWA